MYYENGFYISELYELQLHGHGRERLDSMEDLKANIAELYFELKDIPDKNLGVEMQNYKKILSDILF